MKQVVQKILLFIAVFTVTAHSIIPHYHHDETSVALQHHDHEDEQTVDLNHHDQDNGHHNIFSFAQLDENFVPVKWQKICAEISVSYLSTPIITYQLNLYKARSKITVGYYQEFPPPGNYLSNLFSRPPPTC